MLTPAAPPQPVPVFGGFDYVTIDARRHRMYAAHTGSRVLLIVDTERGAILGQVRVGPMHGVAFDPSNGHVFTGNGDDNTVSEVDPVAMTVVRSVRVAGPVDALVYDPGNARIYADEDDGTNLFVIDAKTFNVIKSVALPGHKPEYLAVNPTTHEVYQNIDNLSEIAVVDPGTLAVSRTIVTPEIRANHPLQFDAQFDQIVAGGTDPSDNTKGVLVAYTSGGKKLGQVATARFDQCDLDPTQHVLACAGGGGISRFRLIRGGAPTLLETTPVSAGVRTNGIDGATHAVWAVWGDRDGKGDFVQRFDPSP